MNKKAEETLLSIPKVASSLNQALEIARRYYPNSSPNCGVIIAYEFEGFELGVIEIEGGINASLRIEFEQDTSNEEFPFNPYRLLRICFDGDSLSEEPYLDIAYITIGDKDYNNWMADKPQDSAKIADMCEEIFLAFKDLSISAEFK